MWDYALLSKTAKKFGGPVAFISFVFAAGRIYERRYDIIDESIEVIESINAKVKELKNKKRLSYLKKN